MEGTIEVRYLWNNDKPNGDLVCELTEFMDKYLLYKAKTRYCKTYLYNDLGVFSTDELLRIAFRYPGATRGSILLERISYHKFKIVGFQFNMDQCFDEFACYDRALLNDIDDWVGKILDFSNVTLVNNGVCNK